MREPVVAYEPDSCRNARQQPRILRLEFEGRCNVRGLDTHAQMERLAKGMKGRRLRYEDSIKPNGYDSGTRLIPAERICRKARSAGEAAEPVEVEGNEDVAAAQVVEAGGEARAIGCGAGGVSLAGRAFLQIQAPFAELERNVIRQRVREGVRAARARGRKGGRPRVMTREKLRYAQNLMVDQARSILDISRS